MISAPAHPPYPRNLRLKSVKIREIRGAAHKAARAAGESPVRDETNVPVVITDLWVERSRTGKLGSKRPVQSGASKMAGRNIK
jgi:hypothetical protein